jgi:purine-nucleoside phosphorylase
VSKETDPTHETVERASALLRAAASETPRVGLVLGSGLGPFAETLEAASASSYAELPGFPEPGVAGHAGRLLLGRAGGLPVAVMQGRAHYYESGRADAMKVPLRTLAALGCESLLLTNAAGSLKPEAGPGSVMMLSDHINFTGVSPLFGEPDDSRFVDMVDAYDPALQALLRAQAAALGITLHEGVYLWFCGPNFETPAEIRAAAALGADAVGMSTVPEVILARHAGLKVAALSIITNHAAGMSGERLSHQQTIANAAKAADAVQRLIGAFLAAYGN